MLYKKIIRPLFFSFDAESIHHIVMNGLGFAGRIRLGKVVENFCSVEGPLLEGQFHGLKFKNPLGIAAGLDKYVKAGEMWGSLGFSHAEFGTVTLRSQPGNPGKRLWRIKERQSLQNFMGLNNPGAAEVVKNISQIKADNYLKGISISSNTQLIEPSELESFLSCYELVVEEADYVTFNLSCPNVKDHRGLLSSGFIDDLLTNVRKIENKLNISKPLFIKIPPIHDIDRLEVIVNMAEKHHVAGIIATNTKGDFSEAELGFKLPSEKGGVSGKILYEYSLKTVILLHSLLSSKDIIVVGAGGIFTAEQALAMIRAGASLIQAYTGFIYEGPFFAKQICQGIVDEVKRLGLSNYRELIGMGEK